MEQSIDLGFSRPDFDDKTLAATLILTTYKPYEGGLRSTATVMWVGESSRQHAIGAAGGGDYSRTLAADRNVRATQKAIERQHAQVFTQEVVAEVTAEVKAHYEANASAKAA